MLRYDGRVFYVASADLLGGRLPPSEWTKRSFDQAVDWLLGDALVVPGVATLRWSDGWRPERRDGFQPTFRLYRYYNLDAKQAKVVASELALRVKDRFDCELDVVPRASRNGFRNAGFHCREVLGNRRSCHLIRPVHNLTLDVCALTQPDGAISLLM